MLRFDATGPIGKYEQLPDGSLRIDARLARVGNQTYYMGGKRIVERRDASEVFAPAALASFRHATLTVGHPGAVNPGNFRKHAVGHVAEDVRQDGDYLAASVIVRDQDTIERVLSRELVELSCGYRCDTDDTPGEDYDRRQINIVGNHVALLKEGQGRAGSEVRLRLDSNQDQIAESITEENSGQENSQATDSDRYNARMPTQEQFDAEKARADKAESRFADLTSEFEKVKAQLAEVSSRADAADAKLAAERSAKIRQDAAPITSDATGSDRDVMERAIKVKFPDFRCDANDNLEPTFRLALAQHAKDEAQKLADATKSAPNRQDKKDDTQDSRAAFLESSRVAWKQPLSVTGSR